MHSNEECTHKSILKTVGTFFTDREFQHKERVPFEASERGKEKSEKRTILSERSFAERVKLFADFS